MRWKPFPQDLLGEIEETALTNNINFYFSLALSTFDDSSSHQDSTIMKSEDTSLSIFLFSQTGTGVLGNTFLICLFLFVFFSGHRMRLIDGIVTQLALANCLVLLLKGIPQTMTSLGLMNFLDDIGCKIIFYLHKVARDLSLGTTCLLSAFQAITISPTNSNWAELKARASKYLIPCSLLCWTFHLVVYSYVPWGVKGPRQNRNISEMQHHGYCSHKLLSGFHASLMVTFLSFIDAIYLGLMVSASGYMVILLYRHHKQIKQIHITYVSPRASPEIRATKTILLLVSTFISSYLLNCILAAYMSLIKSPLWLMHISAFLGLYFPAVSPYVLISSDSQVIKYLYILCGSRIPQFNLKSRLISSVHHDLPKATVTGKSSPYQMRLVADHKN